MRSITPLQALRRLVDVARLIDADECPELYNQLQAELGIAYGVMRDFLKSDIIIANRLRYAVADPMWTDYAEVSKRLLVMAAENMEAARARIVELEAIQPTKHADDFAHFLSYSGLSAEPADVLEKMRMAFEAARPVEVVQKCGSCPKQTAYGESTCGQCLAAQDARDAARYRWLRDFGPENKPAVMIEGRWYGGKLGNGVGFDLDTAIDAAMALEKK